MQIRKQNHQEIQTGIMFCASCSEKYPIVSDRPVLMVNNAVHNWLSPIDEALNPSENRRPEGPLSILRLKRLGVETAVGIAASQDKKCIDDSFDISSDLKKLKGKIKYIKSGNWLNARGRKTGFLSALTNPSESVSSFLKLLTSRNPSSVLDIASGGGSGVVAIADSLKEDVRIFSLERDLQCLWIIQEKFKYIGKQKNSEAIGADVRQLPIKKNSVDMVTSMMAMQEILGISSVLNEIHRVLKPGGSYIALFNKEPWVYDMIPIEQYKSFAKSVDMYSGYEDLVSKAQKQHLVTAHIEEFTDNGKEFCLVEFGKVKK